MKTKSKNLIGIILIVAAFGVGWFAWTQQPSEVTVSITGRSGLAFAGVIKADGAVRSVSGIVPTNYMVSARLVECRLEKQQDRGKLGVAMKMKRLGGACVVSTSESGRGVTARLGLHEGGCSSF
jgi:hypothetical protein